MSDQLKSNPNSKEFNKYLQNFVKSKERQNRKKIMREIASSVALMIAG